MAMRAIHPWVARIAQPYDRQAVPRRRKQRIPFAGIDLFATGLARQLPAPKAEGENGDPREKWAESAILAVFLGASRASVAPLPQRHRREDIFNLSAAPHLA
jgi:hypothetical protein